jgi:hypothetical protein
MRSNQWSPVVILDGGKCHGIQTGERLILDPVGSDDEALQVAANACLSMPGAIACTIQPCLCEVGRMSTRGERAKALKEMQ